MLDLEKVAHREAIERSADLRSARKSARLRLMSNSVLSQQPEKVHFIERIIEKYIEPSGGGIDEKKLEAMMRRLLAEQKKEPAAFQDSTATILNAVDSLKEQLTNMRPKEESFNMPNIDPAKFADLQSKAIEKISETIETGARKTPKKVKLKNTRSTDLASELD